MRQQRPWRKYRKSAIPEDAKIIHSCAGRTIYRGVIQSRVPKDEWIGLVGSGGGLGHLGIQFAKALGMKVVGIDARDEGLELSKKSGADLVVDARRSKEDVVKSVQEHTGGEGCYATVCISDAKTAWQNDTNCPSKSSSRIVL